MELDRDWWVAAAPAGRFQTPQQLADAQLDWRPAVVPGTVAAAVGHEGRDLDAEDWWFRCAFRPEQVTGEGDLLLELDGLATVCEVFLGGEEILRSSSMWRAHSVPIDRLVVSGSNDLVIVCRALAPLLAKPRRPRARWRTRVVNDNNLRWYRTMIFGRSPGFAPGPAAVGPWRPVRVRRRAREAPEPIALSARLEGGAGHVRASAPLAPDAEPRWSMTVAGRRADAEAGPDGLATAELRLDDVRRWWPHTHGEPHLYDVTIELDGEPVDTRRIGFRELVTPADIAQDGFALECNGVAVHLRGAVWTPVDLVRLAPEPAHLRRILELVRDCGMNLLRVTGTGHYESREFHDLCDELGILVWQDLMFANLDYPLDDDEFRAEVEAEAREVVSRLAHRPSLVCVCGNSEVEQQPAMMGLDPALGRHPFWEQTLPRLVREHGADAPCVRSTPCGGTLPFAPDGGITHYFGVSGWFRGLDDARRSEVRFATECLAFANVPDDVEVPVHHPRWKAGVQRDAGSGWNIGAGWDFDDVRDHYLAMIYGVDPVQLRRSDHARYLALSRAVTGEVMAQTMGEWRRSGSPCRGALVLWLTDMAAGGGLGILDERGRPKVCYHHLRRALAPIAVWMTDEGLAGIAVHAANDRPTPQPATLRVALYRDGAVEVAGAAQALEIGAHQTLSWTVEGLLGRFIDSAWAYRLGPPTADAVVATLESDDPLRPLSQAFWFPAGRPLDPQARDVIGLEGTVTPRNDGSGCLTVRSHRLAYGVRVSAPGFSAGDDAFCLEPGRPRAIELSPTHPDATFSGATVTALNAAEPVSASETAELGRIGR